MLIDKFNIKYKVCMYPTNVFQSNQEMSFGIITHPYQIYPTVSQLTDLPPQLWFSHLN